MKINAARIKALVLAALAALAGWAAGNPDVVATLPAWARAALGFVGAIYATAFVSSTEVKSGDPKGIAGMKVELGGPTALLLIVGLALALPACPAGCPNPPPVSKVAHCAVDAAGPYVIDLTPKINGCLAQMDFSPCLNALEGYAPGVTIATIACLVRESGAEFGAQAQMNPADSVSATNAKHADVYVAGWSFED